MAKSTKNNIRLGLFVTVGVAIFTLGVYVIGNQQNLFRPRYHLSTFVSNANGLRIGNNVRYAGIVVGSVDDLKFVNDSSLEVRMVLDAKMKPIIRKDAVASIGLDGLVGNVIVNIAPGPGKGMPAADGDTIPSFSRLDPGAIMETLGSASNNVSDITERILEISDALQHGDGTVPLLIHDKTVAEDLAASARNLRLATDNIAKISAQLSHSMDAVSQGKGTLGYLLHNQDLPQQLEKTAERIDSMLVVQAQPILQDLQQSGKDIAASGAALKSALQSLENGDGLAGTLLKDSTASDNMQEILENLKDGTDRFNQNMEALKHNFLFRRYFKKLEKQQKKENKQEAD